MTPIPPSAESPDTMAGRKAGRVIELFARGEAFDASGFASSFTDDAIYQFGNTAICRTFDEIRRSTEAFFGQLQALYHSVRPATEVGDTVFVEMDVLYWRPDGSSVRLPCADLVRFTGDRIAELRIFMDAAPLADPSIPVADTASVHVLRGGVHEPIAGTMRHFFTTATGRRRIEAGFAPKWSVAGPMWPIAPSPSPPGSKR